MNPLTGVLGMLAGTVASGAVLTAAATLGLLGWAAAALALAVGLFGALALGGRIEAAVKRADPAWDERRDRPRPIPLPVPRAARDRFDPRHHWRR